MPKDQKKGTSTTTWMGRLLQLTSAFANYFKYDDAGDAIEDDETAAARATAFHVLSLSGYIPNDEPEGADLGFALSGIMAFVTAPEGTTLQLTGDDQAALPRVAEEIHRFLKTHGSTCANVSEAAGPFFAQFGSTINFVDDVDAGLPNRYTVRKDGVILNAERNDNGSLQKKPE